MASQQERQDQLYKELKQLIRKHRHSLSPANVEGHLKDLTEAMHARVIAMRTLKFPSSSTDVLTPDFLDNVRRVLVPVHAQPDLHERINQLSRRIEDVEKRINNVMNELQLLLSEKQEEE